MRIVTFDNIRYKIFDDNNGGIRAVHIERVPNSDHFEKMTVAEIEKYVAAVVRTTVTKNDNVGYVNQNGDYFPKMEDAKEKTVDALLDQAKRANNQFEAIFESITDANARKSIMLAKIEYMCHINALLVRIDSVEERLRWLETNALIQESSIRIDSVEERLRRLETTNDE
jgi:hypothetical protein